MFQRAIWATIIRIYSYGKAVFSTSFESAATPKQAMTAFMSANLDYLRELVITEIDNNTPADKQRGRVVHPQSYTPVPIDGLIVSRGTLTDTIFTVTQATEDTTLQVSMPAPASQTETLTQYAQRIGLTEETTYTIMANIVDKDINILYPVKINSPYAINYQSYFGAVRLTLKHLLSEKPISQATLADLFDIVRIGNTFTPSFGNIAFGSGTWNATTLLRDLNAIGTLAVSAYNTITQKVSNSTMNWIRLQNTYGIISKYAISIWGKNEHTTFKTEFDYEVEYIEMNNKVNPCYLDLGIILEENIYDLYVEFTLLGYPNYNAYAGWFGCWNNYPDYSIGVNKRWTLNNQGAILIAASTQDRARFFETEYNTKYNISLNKNGEIYINGNYIGKSNNDNKYNGKNTFKVFRNDNDIEQYVNYTNGRIHGIKIWKEEQLIHNFIPVVKDSRPCLYDKIGKIFSTTIGNDNLTAGPKI